MFPDVKLHIPHQSLLPADMSGWLLMYVGHSPSRLPDWNNAASVWFPDKSMLTKECWKLLQVEKMMINVGMSSSLGVPGPRCRGGARLPGQWSASAISQSCWQDGGRVCADFCLHHLSHCPEAEKGNTSFCGVNHTGTEAALWLMTLSSHAKK